MAQTMPYPQFPYRLRLDRHDGPADDGGVTPPADPAAAGEPAARADPPKPAAEPDPKPAAKADDGKPARHVPVEDLAKERERRKQAADDLQRANARLAELEAKVTAAEDAEKSELEKMQATAERANARAADAERRVVTSEIRLAAAAAGFADPSDAVAFLGADLAPYLVDGGINTEAVEAAVTGLLEKKPHLKRAEPAVTPAPKPRATPAPAPDPSQGSRGGSPETDFRTAPKEDLDKELARYGVRL
jgi:hypothetical protein